MKKITQLKAIRLKCLDCSNQQPKEVENCPVKACPLWTFRFGKSPETVAKHGEGDKVKRS